MYWEHEHCPFCRVYCYALRFFPLKAKTKSLHLSTEGMQGRVGWKIPGWDGRPTKGRHCNTNSLFLGLILLLAILTFVVCCGGAAVTRSSTAELTRALVAEMKAGSFPNDNNRQKLFRVPVPKVHTPAKGSIEELTKMIQSVKCTLNHCQKKLARKFHRHHYP